MISSPITWYGGKARLAKRIIAHFPPHQAYLEPFGGSFEEQRFEEGDMTKLLLWQRPWSDEYDGLPHIRACYGCPDRNDGECLDPRCWNDKKTGCERMMECRGEWEKSPHDRARDIAEKTA